MTGNTSAQVSSVKMVGANRQISLGKQFAGRQVLIEEQEAGVWLVRTATVVPDNESWLLMSAARSNLNDALSWASRNVPNDDALEDTLKHLSHG